MSLRDTDVVRVVDIRFPLPKPLYLPQAVQDDRRRDRVQPRRERGIATERAEPVERANERFLGNVRSEEHTSELQSLRHLVCRLLLEKKKQNQTLVESSGIGN